MADTYRRIIYMVYLISWVTAQTLVNVCDDVDTAACTALSKVYHNLCQDPCTRDICQKHCGLCPLTCYSCTGIPKVEDCHQQKVCTGVNQSCIVTQTVSSAFEILYHLECADSQVCDNLYKPAATAQGKRSMDLYGGCCNTDLCNKHVPSANQIQTTTQPTVPSNHQGTTNVIYGTSDINQEICQKVVKTANDCKIPCNLKMCPQTCQQLTCYKCDYLTINNIHLCTRTVQCSPGEECIISEVFDASFNPGYTLGCASKQVCDRLHLHNGSQVSIGNTSDVAPNGVCCQTSFCNKNHTFVQSTLFPVVTRTISKTHPSPCLSNPCKNGYCHDISNSSYHCNCDLGWKGNNCDILSACFSHPCQHNQECHDNGHSYTCRCPLGYTGQSCEQIRWPCSSQYPCKNGGHCRNVGNTTTCACTGYVGSHCEKHCPARNTCDHGFVSIPGLENCYKFGHPTHYFNWEDARVRCNNMCSNLLSIENHHEELLISRYIRNQVLTNTHDNVNHGQRIGDFWLDSRRFNSHSDFYWTSTGNKVSYTNWKGGHHLDANCVAFGPGEGFDPSHHEYYWNAINCTRALLVACEHRKHH